MTQPSLLDYMNEKEEIKVSSEIDNPTIKNIEHINESNEIIEIRYGDEIYKNWKVKFIRPYIYKFLKEVYPNSIIAREINQIDITIFDNITNEQIPVEIQKTPISYGKFAHHAFEQSIRTQIDINVKTYGICWLFFDSEYHKLLQSGNIGKTTNVDLTWLVKLMRETTLKVFSIKYDGTVKELTTKDFDFLKNMSQICQIGEDNDERILNKNKLKIYHNAVNSYKFTQEEITQFENEFDNHESESKGSLDYFMKSNNKRCKLYGDILNSIRSLPSINRNLSCTCNKRIIYGVTLGLFEQNEFIGMHKNARIKFVNKFDVAQYFPGYLRNKELWDYCKEKQRIFTVPELSGITEGTFNYEFIKKQSTMKDF